MICTACDTSWHNCRAGLIAAVPLICCAGCDHGYEPEEIGLKPNTTPVGVSAYLDIMREAQIPAEVAWAQASRHLRVVR